jgi:hypothetical protein
VQTWLDKHLYRQFANLAEKHERSLNAQARIAIKEQLERENGKR